MTYVIILLMFIINENNAKLELLKNKISNNKSFAITGLTSFLRLFTVSKTASEKKILFITSTEQSALKYQSDLNTMFDLSSEIFPYQDVSMYEAVSPNLYNYAKQVEILGPTESNLFFLKKNYRYRFLIKSPKTIPLQNQLNEIRQNFKCSKKVQIKFDVDCYNFL